MKVILVDDEPKALGLLTSYLKHFSSFELVGTFRNGLKALEFLNTNTVDVVFLDINMPHLSGLSLSKMLPKETAIVFTTAYSEHAVESYDVHTIDYLLKPISLERFSKSITKLLERTISPVATVTDNKPSSIFVKSGLETHQLHVAAITHLQKEGNYLYYFTADTKIMARQSIGEALATLPENFIQVQKSYIVNINAIASFHTDSISIGAYKIPIGSQHKAAVLTKLQ
jgi:DNA-binding LytR/AlgR family response regulator